MQGVEILTMSQVATEWEFNCAAFWITYAIMVVLCTFLGLYWFLTNQCEWGVIPALFILGALFGIPVGYSVEDMYSTPVAYETQYKVTISDEVSMNEFIKHYEVIDQDGKIFIVTEKK